MQGAAKWEPQGVGWLAWPQHVGVILYIWYWANFYDHMSSSDRPWVSAQGCSACRKAFLCQNVPGHQLLTSGTLQSWWERRYGRFFCPTFQLSGDIFSALLFVIIEWCEGLHAGYIVLRRAKEMRSRCFGPGFCCVLALLGICLGCEPDSL